MTDDGRDIQRLSPDKLMTGFAASPIWTGLLISLAAHVVVIGGTSLGYVYGLVDTKWAAERKADKEDMERARKAADLKEQIDSSRPDTGAGPEKTDGTKPEGAPAGKEGAAPVRPERKMTREERLMKERADTPVVKAVTEAASPEDIPKEPDLGISLDETNPD